MNMQSIKFKQVRENIVALAAASLTVIITSLIYIVVFLGTLAALVLAEAFLFTFTYAHLIQPYLYHKVIPYPLVCGVVFIFNMITLALRGARNSE